MTFLDYETHNNLSPNEQLFVNQFPGYWMANETKGIGILKENYIIYANSALLKYLNVTKTNPIDHTPFSQYFTHEVSTGIQNFENHSNDNEVNFSTFYFKSFFENTENRLKLLISKIPSEENLFQITIDIMNDHNKIDEIMIEKEHKLESLFEAIPIGISILNEEKQVLYQNPALEKILDLTKEGLKNGLYRNRTYLRPDGSDMPLTEFPSYQAFIEKKPIYDIEIGIIKENHEILWTSVSAIPVPYPDWKMILVTSDISNRKKLELSLKKNEQFLSDTNYIAHVGGLEYNLETKEVSWTKEVYRIHEVDFDFKPKLLYETKFYSSTEMEILEKATKKLIEEGKSINEQVQLTTAKGNRRWVQIRGKPEFSDRKIKKILGTIQDISEIKQLHDKLTQIQKFESLGILSAGIAHEFNNLLCGIQGFTDIIIDMENNPEKKEYMENIKEISVRAGDLIKKLMYFSRKGKNLVEAVCMNTLIHNTIDLIQKTKPENIQITLNLLPNLGSVDGDPNQLSQLLVNVCLNSFEAMPNGGNLRINTTNIRIPEDIAKTMDLDFKIPYILIDIYDNGIGMSEEVKHHIFDPFFTTKKNGFLKGSGLGLPIVYGIVKSHNGMMEIESQQNKGTTIKIYLPQGIKEPIVRKELKTDIPTIKPMTVLILEDEEIIQKMLGQIFQTMKFNVFSALDGQIGLELYQKRFKEIDLVLLDMKMPRMDGKTAFLQMKNVNPNIKALLMTGYGNNEEAQSILDLGVLGLIEKPFDKNKLIQKINLFLNNK